MKGVLDRIEDEKFAVILAEEEGKEFVTDKRLLPEGAKVHDRLEFTVHEGDIENIRIDKQKTSNRQENAEMLRDRMRSRSKGSKFKR
ncbi:DUF3006 domain-containing protein [Sediminibacillus halophilus]|uniref:DUF3006 domain-containing protein n=1 Tax=Sediminibacillus halophilus TaxID=482461 RepID=A0A1G9NNZ4_9BACI|nr:DUF3006 domain-containing protein [Sediminibacillus halophilus]SDL88306.1 Protein of unknown function [Sediminibacillus halophilus]